MKRIAIIVVMVMMSLAASASSIRYFTRPQAERTVSYLNAQREIMIYCGYDYEIETYVLLNEVWMERINSSYYEIWIYGYDAYTGDEVYMPIDLQCIWLYSAGRMYNAAQYLRFHASVRTPALTWYIPPYNTYVRTVHRTGYVRSYHYDIHRHGWMPPAPPRHGYGPNHRPPLPPYYMRQPQAPAPTPEGRWTPGTDKPKPGIAPSHRSRNNNSNNNSSPTRPTTGGDNTPTAPSHNSGPATSSPSRISNPPTTTTPTTSPSRNGNTNTTSPTRDGNATTATTTPSPSRNGNTGTTTTTPSPTRKDNGKTTSTTTSSPTRKDNSKTTTTTTSSPSRKDNNSNNTGKTPSPSRNSSSSRR